MSDWVRENVVLGVLLAFQERVDELVGPTVTITKDSSLLGRVYNRYVLVTLEYKHAREGVMLTCGDNNWFHLRPAESDTDDDIQLLRAAIDEQRKYVTLEADPRKDNITLKIGVRDSTATFLHFRRVPSDVIPAARVPIARYVPLKPKKSEMYAIFEAFERIIRMHML